MTFSVIVAIIDHIETSPNAGLEIMAHHSIMSGLIGRDLTS